MAKKTNKTSHVLNLITNGEPEMPQSAEAPAAAPPAPEANDKKAGDAKVTVVNTDLENSEVSEEIQKQLLNQIAEESEAGQAGAEMEGADMENKEMMADLDAALQDVPAMAGEAGNDTSAVEAVETKSDASAAPENDTPVAEAKDAAPADAKPEKKEEEQTYSMVNVMEKILERTNVMKQMQDYNVCTCSRCRADVLALVLTRLPAKYVVVDQTAANPMISYYESRFRMRILTEMIKSCIDVRDNPRH